MLNNEERAKLQISSQREKGLFTELNECDEKIQGKDYENLPRYFLVTKDTSKKDKNKNTTDHGINEGEINLDIKKEPSNL